MKPRLIKLLTILIISIASYRFNVLAQSKTILGVYRECPFACRFIKINADFTFEQLLDGDLFNKQRTSGTWKFIGDKKIKAESAKRNKQLQVKETIGPRTNFLVIIIDTAGATLPNTEIIGKSGEKVFKCITSDSGNCEIPKAKEFIVNVLGYHGTYVVKDISANEFLVQLTFEQLEPQIDEIWLIEKNRLFVADEKGNFDKKYWLEKVTDKRMKTLFP